MSSTLEMNSVSQLLSRSQQERIQFFTVLELKVNQPAIENAYTFCWQRH